MPGTCPSTEALSSALRGDHASPGDAELSAHLDECAACCARLEELAGGSGWMGRRTAAPGEPPSPPSDLLQLAMERLEARTGASAAEAASPCALEFLQPSQEPGAIGRFGPYEVLARVATGGMGIVLKARDPALDRIVALKILPPALAAQALARARFIREARAAAAVVHDHVVPIYAVDDCGGLPYLVMPYIMGLPLSDRLRLGRPLRLEEILRIGAQAAAGLAAAHAQGLIHRDVKPSNILLENSIERVKLTDFGLARTLGDSSMTLEGHIAGTPEYMSPEQARGEPVDQRTDLFSIGCVLYEMATGISPFRSERPMVALRRVCDEDPPAAVAVNPQVPDWLSQLIQHLMAKKAAARPASAAELASELSRRLAAWQQGATEGDSAIKKSSPDSSGNARPGQSSWNRWLVWALPVLLVVGFMLRRATTPEATGPAAQAPTPPPLAPPSVEVVPPPDVPRFLIPATGDVALQEFDSLTAAVAAAVPGSAIELCFNGVYATPAIDLLHKPMILRAGTGFEPVLASTNPHFLIVASRAPLVLEGLTFLLAWPPGHPGDRPRREDEQPAGVAVHDRPCLVAHCRFEVAADQDTQSRHPISMVRLVNVRSATFLNTEFKAGRGIAIAALRRARMASGGAGDRYLMRGCVVHGNLLSGNRLPHDSFRLELRGNSIAGGALALSVPSRGPAESSVPFLRVVASNNVFALDRLLQPVRRDPLPLAQLVQWEGSDNVFDVGDFCANSTPPVTTHQEWLASGATTETNSFATNLKIRERLSDGVAPSRTTESAAWVLSADERAALSSLGWTPATPAGADPQKTGPGQHYHQWKASDEYQEWLDLMRDHLPQAPSPDE